MKCCSLKVVNRLHLQCLVAPERLCPQFEKNSCNVVALHAFKEILFRVLQIVLGRFSVVDKSEAKVRFFALFNYVV